MPEISILIVDDQRLVREGIKSLLNIQEGINVIGTATNGQEAINESFANQPNVILMDIRMPVLDGIEATRQIIKKLPDTKILMLTTFDDEEYIVKSLQAGASGYLLKDIPAEDLAQAVRLTYSGLFQFDPSVAGKLIGQLHTRETKKAEPDQAIVSHLTQREMEVLKLIATGATNKEIAEILVISEGTVKNHVSNLLNQLGLRDRIQAAIFAHENKLF